MIRKLKKFYALSMREKVLFAEAFILLGIMRGQLLMRPFKKLTSSLSQSLSVSVPQLEPDKEAQAVEIGYAIRRASRVTPWESACLVQALCARKMLSRRGIRGVFFLGVAKELRKEEKMSAHAWAQCGNTIITGKEGHRAFTVVSVFCW